MRKLIVAVTGATGHLYLVEFLRLLAGRDVEVHAIISDAGRQVLHLETGLNPEDLPGIAVWHEVKNLAAPMASGSARFDAMIVLPCTMGSLAAIATGMSINLIHRAADVMLKEKKPLLLAVRETPFNRNHLENMLRAHDAGATICPAMPSFYHKPADLSGMARHYAGRLCDLLGIEIADLVRWK